MHTYNVNRIASNVFYGCMHSSCTHYVFVFASARPVWEARGKRQLFGGKSAKKNRFTNLSHSLRRVSWTQTLQMWIIKRKDVRNSNTMRLTRNVFSLFLCVQETMRLHTFIRHTIRQRESATPHSLRLHTHIHTQRLLTVENRKMLLKKSTRILMENSETATFVRYCKAIFRSTKNLSQRGRQWWTTQRKNITNEIASAGMRMLNASNARYLRFMENGKLFALEIIVLRRWQRRRRPQNSYFIRNRAIGFTKKRKEEILFSKCSQCGKRARSIAFVPFDFLYEKSQTSRYSSTSRWK